MSDGRAAGRRRTAVREGELGYFPYEPVHVVNVVSYGLRRSCNRARTPNKRNKKKETQAGEDRIRVARDVPAA